MMDREFLVAQQVVFGGNVVADGGGGLAMESLRFGESCDGLPVFALEGQLDAAVVFFLGVRFEGWLRQVDVYGGVVECGGWRVPFVRRWMGSAQLRWKRPG